LDDEREEILYRFKKIKNDEVEKEIVKKMSEGENGYIWV
jgi:hypothetical protein